MQYKDDSEQTDKLGAIVYAVLFTVYIGAMVTLALAGVGLVYFVVIALIGFPVSGITLSMIQGKEWLKRSKVEDSTNTPEDIRSEYVNEAGEPVIKL